MFLNRFIAELRRRNVFRVALAYLAVAWLIIQLVNEIGPILGAPEWLPQVTLGLLGGGFFIALILSWLYEVTTVGIRTMAEVDRDASLHAINGRKLNFFIIGILLLALGYFIWESRFSDDWAVQGGIDSVAVLPFRDMSTNQNQAYFAEGMAEELLNALSRIQGLKVAGRTSSFSFRDSTDSMEKIAGQLQVSHLLEGSVRTSGEQLRVTAQLINARDGFQLWSHEFQGRLTDVFEVQDEISRRVVESLRSGLDVAVSPVASRSQITTSIDAYQEYLLGRYQLARRTRDGVLKSQAHFLAAAESDPDYSPAWSALATAYAISPWYGLALNPVDIARQARESAQRALALDNGNSEAWAAQGTVYMTFDRDWERAEQALKRAVELDPAMAGNANLYGDYLYITGDYKNAAVWEGRAAELEPLSAVHQHELALVFNLLGETGAAIDLELKALDLSPEFSNGWASLGRFYGATGNAEAIDQLLKNKEAALDQHSRLALLIQQHQLRSEPDLAYETAEELLKQILKSQGSMTIPARMFAELGDGARAAELVLEARRADDPLLISPLYFFLPEDWRHLPELELALSQPELVELHELRRANAARGRGRGGRW